jgi:hypothetical protein
VVANKQEVKMSGETTLAQAKAFYDYGGLVPAYQLAATYAGEHGRIAIMPDIVNARLHTKPDRPLGTSNAATPWTFYYTTASAEYTGFTKGGTKIIIVAHGVGPMETLEGMRAAYSFYRNNGDDDGEKGGRISWQEFLKLESGHYGDVSIVEVKPLLNRYEWPFREPLRVSKALAEPLLEARLGKRAKEYISRHRALTNEVWQEENLPDDPPTDPVIIFPHAPPFYMHFAPGKNFAYAHLLSVGPLLFGGGVGDEPFKLYCEVATHDLTDGTRFVGVRGLGEIVNIEPSKNPYSEC